MDNIPIFPEEILLHIAGMDKDIWYKMATSIYFIGMYSLKKIVQERMRKKFRVHTRFFKIPPGKRSYIQEWFVYGNIFYNLHVHGDKSFSKPKKNEYVWGYCRDRDEAFLLSQPCDFAFIENNNGSPIKVAVDIERVDSYGTLRKITPCDSNYFSYKIDMQDQERNQTLYVSHCCGFDGSCTIPWSAPAFKGWTLWDNNFSVTEGSCLLYHSYVYRENEIKRLSPEVLIFSNQVGFQTPMVRPTALQWKKYPYIKAYKKLLKEFLERLGI